MLETRILQRGDWPLVEALFGSKGACGGCWCMWWRVARGGKLWDGLKGEPNRIEMQRRVAAGDIHAVLALSEGQPVGWCSFGPISDFPRLATVRALQHSREEGTWAVVCFYVHPKWRRHGVAGALLEAATQRAFDLGARLVEGYPVRSKGGSLPGAFAWTGVPRVFETAGYEEVPRPPDVRPVYVKRGGRPGERRAKKRGRP